MATRDDLLKLTQQATLAREHGDLVKSKELFSQIYSQLDALKSSLDPEDKNAYVGIMGEYIIQIRHEAMSSASQALSISKELYAYAQTQNIPAPHLGYSLRGTADTLMDMGRFEEAEKYVLKMLASLDPTNSASVGDTTAHLARCLFRQGKLDEASQKIDEALLLIEQNTGKSEPLPVAVWTSSALMTKALLHKSLDLANQALALAKSQNLAVRTQQAQALVDFLSGK